MKQDYSGSFSAFGVSYFCVFMNDEFTHEGVMLLQAKNTV
ncbi:hypothetical protein FEDK69T_07740 [Flavobacterium enshiense DK69]|nr:hypothetical protein FEDK69T_07740 [Flavobacterium enshiense DK69]